MRILTFLLAGSTSLSPFCFVTPVLAQQLQADTAIRPADEVVVTARAGTTARRKADVSYAITSISGDALRLQAPLSTAEVFKAIPGFWVEASGGEASNNVRTRGIPTDGYSSVTIQEDGLTVQHDGGLGWLNADQSFRLDETIGRVEAVRGGPASIFASNSPGGTVNFITRQAGSEAEGLIKVQLGDYGMYRTDFFYGSPLSENWGLTVGGFFRSDQGIRDPGFTQNNGGQIRVGLSRTFEKGRIDINVKHIDDNVGFLLPVPLTFDGSGDVAAVPGFDANYGTLAGPDNRLLSLRSPNGAQEFDLSRGTDVKLTAVTVKADLDVGSGWRLQNNARYRTSEIVRNGLFPTGSVETAQGRLTGLRTAALAAFPGATNIEYRYATNGAAFNVANQNGNGLVVSGNLLSVSVPLDEFTNDLRMVRKFEFGDQSHDVAFGVYFSSFNYSYDRFMATANLDVKNRAERLDIVATNAAGAVVGRVTDNGILRYGSLYDNAAIDATVRAFYVSDEWQVTPKLRIDGGVRYESIEFSGSVEGKQTIDLGNAGTLADNQFITGTGVFTPIKRDYNDTGFTLGTNYQINDGLGVFARYTDTFRLPSPSEFQGSAGDALRTDIRITPVTMVEGGVKYQSPLFDAYATVFNTRFQNVRFTDNVFSSVTNTFTTRVGYADTATSGVEIEGMVRPVAWAELSVALSWQNPEYENFTFTQNVGGAPVTVSFNGKQLIRVPEIGVRAVPALKLLNGDVRIEVPIEYYSKRFADTANTQSLPAYTVINLNARWNVTDALSLAIAGANLTNEIGLTEGNPRAGQFISGDAGARYFLARPILGRTWRVSASYRF
jgi:outer membrane receptor protein involved in Fe transport